MNFFRQKAAPPPLCSKCIINRAPWPCLGNLRSPSVPAPDRSLASGCSRLAVWWHRHWRLGRRPSQSWRPSAGIAPSRQARHRTPRCSSACVGHLSPRKTDQLGRTRSHPSRSATDPTGTCLSFRRRSERRLRRGLLHGGRSTPRPALLSCTCESEETLSSETSSWPHRRSTIPTSTSPT